MTPPTAAETLKLDPIESPPPVPTFVEYAERLLTKRRDAINERRRATVLGMDFRPAAKPAKKSKRSA